MNSIPKITVITPSYNQAQFIEETINSVLNQQYPNLEYIIMDGGSSDGSVQIIEKYKNRLAYFYSGKDKGQADAINKGFSFSTGDIICWLNSDDLFMPNTLTTISKAFVTHKPDFVYGDAYLFRHGFHWLKRKWKPGHVDAEKMTFMDPIIQPSTFFSRRVIDSIGFLDIKWQYVLDWEFFIRISREFNFHYIPQPFSAYRFHKAHKTGTGGEKRNIEVMMLIDKYASEYWKSLYKEVLPLSGDLAKKKSTWRRFYPIGFFLAHPRLLKKYSYRDLITVTIML